MTKKEELSQKAEHAIIEDGIDKTNAACAAHWRHQARVHPVIKSRIGRFERTGRPQFLEDGGNLLAEGTKLSSGTNQ